MKVKHSIKEDRSKGRFGKEKKENRDMMLNYSKEGTFQGI